MQHNIINTIFPVLNKLGVNTDKFLTDQCKQNLYKIYDKHNICVGVLYMGILFSHQKGAAIDGYLRQTKMDTPVKVFVDDYEPYLMESTASVPDLVAFRRHLPQHKF